MPTQARVVWDSSFTRYDFGPTHPMAPARLDLTARLCDALGVFDVDGVEVVGAEVATDELLATVHDDDYVAAVKAASTDPSAADDAYGLGTEDDPAFVDMHDASARVVSGTVDSCRAVWEGEAEHAVNFTGGLHHAMRGKASGFCVYNDIAVGIQWLLDHGAERVAYVDVDVHHGDGVERIFWDDPRVLTISVHETGRALFPGTGWPSDVGGPDAEGTAVNVALPPGLSDAGWLRALHAVAMPLHRLSHEVCEGRWVALGGGGYEVIGVVPRTWTHLTAIAAHAPIPTSTPVPEDWRAHVEQIFGRPGPRRMGDLTAEDGPLWWRSWEMGYDPASEVDRAVMATRTAVFPLHGLDVHFD